MSLRQESLGEDPRINSGPGESESWVGLGIIWDVERGRIIRLSVATLFVRVFKVKLPLPGFWEGQIPISGFAYFVTGDFNEKLKLVPKIPKKQSSTQVV